MRIMLASEFKLNRTAEYGTPEQNESVRLTLEALRARGDEALLELTEQFDGVRLSAAQLRVTPEEIQSAYSRVEPDFLDAIRGAAANIRAYHERQRRQSWMDVQRDGTILGQVVRPLRRVGVYVPGGKAAYPSSVLMNVIPAQVAGVPEIVMVTPPATGGKAGIDPYILVAAAEAGVQEMYRIGGAQASRCSGLRHGVDSAGRQDLWSRQYLCGTGQASCIWGCRYRQYRGTERDRRAG